MLRPLSLAVLVTLAAFATAVPAQTVVLTPTTTIFNQAGGTLVFSASVSYSTPPSVLAFSANIPSGWSYESTGDNGPNVAPAYGTTGTLDWIYTSAPPSPINFNFTVKYPANVSGAQPLTSSTLTRDTAGSAGVTATGPAVTLTVPSNNGVWNVASGDWATATNWTGLATGVVPNNSGGTTFGASISSGTATIIAPVTVNDLLLLGGTINNGSILTIAGSGSNWEAGVFSGVGQVVGQLVVVPGAFLTATTVANHDFPQATITNNGQFIWNGTGSLRSGNGGAFINAAGATFTDASSGAPAQITNTSIGGTFTFTNVGTYLKTGNTETTISIPFINQGGSLFANAGTLHFGAAVSQTGATGNITVAAGATATFDQGLNLAGGSLIGSGTIMGAVTVPAANPTATFISPGSILGQLNIQGNLTLASTSTLIFDLGNGTTAGTSYDFLNVTGQANLAGTLTLNLVNGAKSTIQSNYIFTLISSTQPLTGVFSNAANGARFFTSDLQSSFLVTYTNNSLTLTGFSTPIPEPSTWALLLTGAAALAFSTRRRRR
jgi:hypothetical protein